MSIKIIGPAITLIALAVAGIAAAILIGIITLPWSATQPEHSARYFPDNVIAFAWMTLNPSMGQREQMQEIWDRFDNTPAFRDWVDELNHSLKDETGFETDDFMTWIGDELSMAVMELSIGNKKIEVGATVAVQDRSAAREFLENWVDYLEDKNAIEFDRMSINGYNVWINEENSQALALTDDLMVFATTKNVLEDILDRVAGKESKTLASNENFTAARAELNNRRFASVYLDYRKLPDAVSKALPLASLDGDLTDLLSPIESGLKDGCGQALFETPEWVMASASWVERGIVFDMVSPAGSSLWPDPSEVVNAADLLPEDSLGFLSLSFDPNLDNLRKALSKCKLAKLIPEWQELSKEVNDELPSLSMATSLLTAFSTDGGQKLGDDSTLEDAMNLGLSLVDRLIGVHLEDDFLDYLGGDFIVAVLDADLEALMAGELKMSPVDGVAMLSYIPEGERGLMGTVDTIVDRLQFFTRAAPEQVDVGAENVAYVFDLEEQAYQPGYVFHDGYFTIGTTTDSLRAVVASQQGEGSVLSGSEKYQRTVTPLPQDRQFLLYVNLNSITSRLDVDNLGINNDEYELLSKGFSAVAMSASSDGIHSRATLVLSFFPEE